LYRRSFIRLFFNSVSIAARWRAVTKALCAAGIIGGKNQGAVKPSVMGSMLQALTYGATIPVIYGMTQSPLRVALFRS
jgi:hypothetical protein